MKKKKIVFFLNAVTLTRCIKRVEEFVDNGYKVEVYGFERGGESYARPAKFKIRVIGSHNIKQSYISRLHIIYKSMRPIIKQYEKDDVLFYFFFFDVAFVGRILTRKPFIYEESDIPYTGINNVLLRNMLGKADKKMIEHSLLTVMTSEGFIDYHFGNQKPSNIIVVPNRVNPRLSDFEYQNQQIDINHLKFAFVGGFRYQSVLNFAIVIGERFPQHEFHVYGNIIENKKSLETLVKNYSNVYYHGVFKNPDELPEIYQKTDIVLATYDATSINAQYAEPNKLYEAIYFRTPIIVSSNTFLAKKVNRLGVGYDINGLDKEIIRSFVELLSLEDLMKKQFAISSLPQEIAININPELFKYLNVNLH